MAVRKEIVYRHIESVMVKAQRDLRRPVTSLDLQPLLQISRAEGSLRRYMRAMYLEGRLVKVGGEGARRGYRLPTRMEKLSFEINRGMWPYGAEKVRTWVM